MPQSPSTCIRKLSTVYPHYPCTYLTYPSMFLSYWHLLMTAKPVPLIHLSESKQLSINYEVKKETVIRKVNLHEEDGNEKALFSSRVFDGRKKKKSWMH